MGIRYVVPTVYTFMSEHFQSNAVTPTVGFRYVVPTVYTFMSEHFHYTKWEHQVNRTLPCFTCCNLFHNRAVFHLL